jgi:hypothetical protein
VRVGFALSDSNLPHQSGFPVFLSHALDWLNPQSKPIAGGLGTVETPWVGATVVDQDGKPVATTATESNTVFVARRPGVYVATFAGQQQQWLVNVVDPKLAEINRSRFNSATKPAFERGKQWPFELWTVVLLGAAALLIIEWFSFSRRLTI